MSAHRTAELLDRAAAGILTASEEAELRALCDREPQVRAKWAAVRGGGASTSTVSERIAASASIEPARETGAQKAWLWVGWGALLLGFVLVYGNAFWSTMRDPGASTAIKLGLVLLVVGLVMPLLYVLRLRLRARGRDPYSEIDR